MLARCSSIAGRATVGGSLSPCAHNRTLLPSLSRALTIVAKARLGVEDALSPLYFMDEARAQAHASPWHDIPLAVGGAQHFVCEVPRGTTMRAACAVGVAHNPIVQVPGTLGIPTIVHHGVLPQTFTHGSLLAAVDLSSDGAREGDVHRVAIIGAVGFAGAAGAPVWHIMTVRAQSRPGVAPLDLGDGSTAAARAPQVVQLAADARHWLRVQPIAEGKPATPYFREGRGSNGTWVSRAVALEIVASAHAEWKALLTRTRPSIGSVYGLEGAAAPAAWVPTAAQL